MTKTAAKKAPAKRPHRATGRPKGRPTKFSEEVAAKIIERLGAGTPLIKVVEDESMPSWGTVYNWIDSNEAFSIQVQRARRIGTDFLAEEALVISNTPMLGVRRKTVTRDIEVNGEVVTLSHVEEFEEDMLGHRKLQVDTRKHLIGCWNPARYGSKVGLTDGNGEPFKLILSTEDQGVL